MTFSDLPRRCLHLSGGLRAIDDRIGPISLEIDRDMRIAQFQAPAYADLYRVLGQWHLKTIGVEFVNQDTESNFRAPDWQSASPTGFKLKDEYRAWCAVSHAARCDDKYDLHYAATRCSTYLDLLNLRVLQLSTAYNRMLRVERIGGDSDNDNLLISNTFLPHIDAAVHAFLADAGTLRDLVSEIAWHFVMCQSNPRITTFGSFLKAAKTSTSQIAQELTVAGANGGWLKILSGLRDRIVHIAPMGTGQDHSCRIVTQAVADGVKLPTLHYPLCAADGSPPPDEYPFAQSEDEHIAVLRRYYAFHLQSLDALEYCWATLNRFVDLLSRIRVIGGFRAEVPTITSADIVRSS